MQDMKELESRFAGKDNYGKPRMDYVRKVLAMTEADLFRETERAIWLSAYAANNPRSDYHWHVDVCFLACEKYPGLYTRAFRTASGTAQPND